jgi:PAS domain S-box-containing protein
MTGNKKSILIVDDVIDNLTVLSELLIAEGYQVRPVTSGALALKTIASGIPDLILLDIKMPEMDGYQLCRRIKVDERLKEIPVIFISAYGEEAEKIKAFEAGGVDYVIKPFHAGEVYARVKTHLALSDAKKALEKLNNELESKIFQRTRELEEMNHQLKITEEKFRKAFHLNPVMMIISSLSSGRIIEVNKAFENQTGYSKEEITGLVSIKESSLPNLKTWDEIFSVLSSEASSKNFEAEYYTKAGEKRMGHLFAEVVEVGSEPCVLTVAEDITERNQNEEMIKEQLNELQRWYNVTLSREDKVIELKQEVNELLERLKEPPRYTDPVDGVKLEN